MKTDITTDLDPQEISAYENKPLMGAVLFGLAIFFIVGMNAFAKTATVYHSPVEVVFYRNSVAMLVLLAYMAVTKQFHVLKTQRIGKHISRSVVGNIGVILVFWSYALMPMADTTAFLFTAPLMLTIMSALFLKERVGVARWTAVVIGFSGVILIARPSGEAYAGYAVIVVLFAAFATALVGIFLRDLGRTENALTTVFYFLAFGIVFTALYMVFAGKFPTGATFWPLIGVGVFSISQLLMKTQAYRLAEASMLSPINFTSIVWATILGWIFWQDVPTAPVIIGTTIIIASNIFIIWRERLKKKR